MGNVVVGGKWSAGYGVGYQTLAYAAGALRCVMAGPTFATAPCADPEATICQAVDNAIDNDHVQWLELYIQDVLGTPDAGAYAHARLVEGAPKGTCP